MIDHPGTGQKLFSDYELWCPCCHGMHFADGFLEALRDLRVEYGKPMTLNSACRCPIHNKEIGGHPRSLHLTTGGRKTGTCGIDVHMTDSVERKRMIELALASGWSVGVAARFLHLDIRTATCGLPQVVYHYCR